MASGKKNGGSRKDRDGREDLEKNTGRRANALGAEKGRQSEHAVSRGGMNQESRQHNKPRPE